MFKVSPVVWCRFSDSASPESLKTENMKSCEFTYNFAYNLAYNFECIVLHIILHIVLQSIGFSVWFGSWGIWQGINDGVDIKPCQAQNRHKRLLLLQNQRLIWSHLLAPLSSHAEQHSCADCTSTNLDHPPTHQTDIVISSIFNVISKKQSQSQQLLIWYLLQQQKSVSELLTRPGYRNDRSDKIGHLRWTWYQGEK